MIRWLLDKIMRWGWDFNRDIRESPVIERKLQANPEVRISIYSAGNGKILELYTDGANPHGSIVTSNQFKLMIVPEGERVSDVVAILLLAEGIK